MLPCPPLSLCPLLPPVPALLSPLPPASLPTPPHPRRPRRQGPRARVAPATPQDPDTTNLYVGNMSPNITEEFLYREFCQYGPIQSVKVC